MTERLLLAAPVFALAILTILVCRRRSPLSPAVFAVGITAAVALFFPIASELVRPLSWRHGVYLPDEAVHAAQVQYAWFMLGMCLVVLRVRVVRGKEPYEPCAARPKNALPTPAVRHRDRVVATGLVIGGALLYSLYVAKVGLGALTDRSDFAEKYRVSSGLGALYGGLNLMILGCLWAEGSALPRRILRLFRLCALGILVWSILFIAVRTYAVALFLGYLYLYTKRRGFTLAQVRPTLILALALGYVGVEGYSLIRGVWQGSFTEALTTLQEEIPRVETTLGQIVGGSELAHPFLTMMELERHETSGALGGASYANGVLGLAPLWLAPNRGASVAQNFARRHYPDLAERGGGTAFSFVGEAWWNFGSMLGPFLVGLAFAWVLMRAERTARRHPDGALQRFLPYTLHLVLLFHRNSSSSLLKQLFTVALPVALLLMGASLVWGAARSRTPQLRPQEAI